jgi:hypothetical protein
MAVTEVTRPAAAASRGDEECGPAALAEIDLPGFRALLDGVRGIVSATGASIDDRARLLSAGSRPRL